MRDARGRTWTIAIDTNEGRLFLNLRDPAWSRYAWSRHRYLGLRFNEERARAIAEEINAKRERASEWIEEYGAPRGPVIVPEGASEAVAVNTDPIP